eukprot:TRINITY_DN525_c0_g2_i1.p1 TRINITY_DN525_c0_g2~~TRINITY_DN525_c0_g2_i1.p1  ORF type:complete len:426 (-),score=-0.84 TRINITY_DN525_c0_g2_i1:807-1964(-)
MSAASSQQVTDEQSDHLFPEHGSFPESRAGETFAGGSPQGLRSEAQGEATAGIIGLEARGRRTLDAQEALWRGNLWRMKAAVAHSTVNSPPKKSAAVRHPGRLVRSLSAEAVSTVTLQSLAPSSAPLVHNPYTLPAQPPPPDIVPTPTFVVHNPYALAGPLSPHEPRPPPSEPFTSFSSSSSSCLNCSLGPLGGSLPYFPLDPSDAAPTDPAPRRPPVSPPPPLSLPIPDPPSPPKLMCFDTAIPAPRPSRSRVPVPVPFPPPTQEELYPVGWVGAVPISVTRKTAMPPCPPASMLRRPTVAPAPPEEKYPIGWLGAEPISVTRKAAPPVMVPRDVAPIANILLRFQETRLVPSVPLSTHASQSSAPPLPSPQSTPSEGPRADNA